MGGQCRSHRVRTEGGDGRARSIAEEAQRLLLSASRVRGIDFRHREEPNFLQGAKPPATPSDESIQSRILGLLRGACPRARLRRGPRARNDKTLTRAPTNRFIDGDALLAAFFVRLVSLATIALC